MQKFVLVAFRILISDKIYKINVKHQHEREINITKQCQAVVLKTVGCLKEIIKSATVAQKQSLANMSTDTTLFQIAIGLDDYLF